MYLQEDYDQEVPGAHVAASFHFWIFAPLTLASTYYGLARTCAASFGANYRSDTETRTSSTGKWQCFFFRAHLVQGLTPEHLTFIDRHRSQLFL